MIRQARPQARRVLAGVVASATVLAAALIALSPVAGRGEAETARPGPSAASDPFRGVGDAAGLDTTRMLDALGSPAVEHELAAARDAAVAAGVRGTPSFEAGPTGGKLEPVTITSFAPDELRARLDALLEG